MSRRNALPMAHQPADPKLLTSIQIPLHCNICSKKPDFSDMSHLLTHIGSKGHLSTYYKLKVKSSADAASLQLIRDYDEWYATHGIESLMSARLHVKEKKQRQKRPLQAIVDAPPEADESSEIDPGLAEHFFKFESYGEAYQYNEPNPDAEPYRHEAYNYEPLSRNTVSYLPSAVYNPFTSYDLPFKPWADMDYTFASPAVHYDAVDQVEPNMVRSPSLPTTRNSMQVMVDLDPGLGPETAQTSKNDPIKLKGVFWPGMDLFDSATTEMKRRRNQKKADSAVDKLEVLSRQVESTECKFTAEGDLICSREITGLPDSDSINGDDLPTPKLKPPVKTPIRKSARRASKVGKVGKNSPIRSSTRGRGRGRGRGRPEQITNVPGPILAPRKPCKKLTAKDRADGKALAAASSPPTHVQPAYILPVRSSPDWLRTIRNWPSPARDEPTSPGLASIESSLLAGWNLFSRPSMANPLYMPAFEDMCNDDEEGLA